MKVLKLVKFSITFDEIELLLRDYLYVRGIFDIADTLNLKWLDDAVLIYRTDDEEELNVTD